MRSSPSQSSPLAGPPLANTGAVPPQPAAPSKTKKQLEKEQKERAAADVKQREQAAKDRKRAEKLAKEEAKQKAKTDRIQAKEQKKQAEKAAAQRLKAAQASRVTPVKSAPTVAKAALSPATAAAPLAPASRTDTQRTPAPTAASPSSIPPAAREPKLERRKSLVAILGRQRKPSVDSSTRPTAIPSAPTTPETVKQSPAVRSMNTPRMASPAPSQGSLTKSKSSVWGTFKRKLSLGPVPTASTPPPPAKNVAAAARHAAVASAAPPATPSHAIPPTPILPSGYNDVTPSSYDPATSAPRRMSVSEAQPHPLPAGAAPSAITGASPSLSPSRDAYQSLSARPPSIADERATIDLARVTSLPQSIATAESGPGHRNSAQEFTGTGMSRQTTRTSVDRISLQRTQSADKNLPPLPVAGVANGSIIA